MGTWGKGRVLPVIPVHINVPSFRLIYMSCMFLVILGSGVVEHPTVKLLNPVASGVSSCRPRTPESPSFKRLCNTAVSHNKANDSVFGVIASRIPQLEG